MEDLPKKAEKILVTGGSGLVAHHLKPLLPDATYVSSKDHDLTEKSHCDRLLNQGWDRIIHLPARVGGILDNQARPLDYLEENILMNTYFLRKARKMRVKRLTAMLSSCIYPINWHEYPMREDVIFKGEPSKSNYGYAIAKRALGIQVDMCNDGFQKSRDLRDNACHWNYLIACNLYGEGDKDGHAQSHFITALIRKIYDANLCGSGFINLLGDGTPMRQFMHAKDLAMAIKRMIDEDITESFNVTVPENYTIRDMAEIGLMATGSGHLKVQFDESEAEAKFRNGEHRKDISNEKMMSLMPGFEFTSLADGIRAAYEDLQRIWKEGRRPERTLDSVHSEGFRGRRVHQNLVDPYPAGDDGGVEEDLRDEMDQHREEGA